VNPIRVLVANRPRLIRELVSATISDQPDIQVVGEIQQETEMENAVEQMQRRRFSGQALPSRPARLHPSSDRIDSERFHDADTSPRFPGLDASCTICHFSSGDQSTRGFLPYCLLMRRS